MKYVLIVLVLFIIYIYTRNDIHTIYGKVARTDKELKKGLMFRKHKLNDTEGMLFIMRKDYDNSVWMKNTYISLDVIFLDSTMTVSGYKTNTKPLNQAFIFKQGRIKVLILMLPHGKNMNTLVEYVSKIQS